jgi:hypothetical protein
VVFSVMLGGLSVMMGGMRCMAMRRVSMVRSFFVVTALIVFGGFAMMTCCVFMMIGCGAVVFRTLMFHDKLLHSTLSDLRY